MPTPEETQAQYGTLAAQPTTPTAPPVVNPNVPTPPVSEVLSPTNVAQTLTAPAAPYDYSDPLKIQARVREELGLGKVESEYQAAIDNLRKFDTGTATQQFNIEQELNPLGVIRGEQATAAGQRSLYRQGYADTAQALADRYNALNTEATNRFNILNAERSTLQSLMIANPGAKITYTDTVETANKKVADWQKKEAKKAEKKAKEAEKEAYKKQLKAALIDAGLSTKGAKGGSLSSKEMEALLTKNNADLLAEARRKASGGTAGQRTGAVVSEAQNALLASRGTDGKVDPQVYAQYRAKYASQTGDVTGFDQQFGGLLSDQEQSNLGVKTTGAKPATATQQLASGFANRLSSATDILSKYDALGSELTGSISGSKYFPNVLKSSDRQQMEQAQRDFINAQLRRESGAVISEQEFDNAAKQYFAQPGDSAGVLQQKAEARRLAVENMKQAAGPSYQQLTGQDEEQILRDAGYTDEQIQLLKNM